MVALTSLRTTHFWWWQFCPHCYAVVIIFSGSIYASKVHLLRAQFQYQSNKSIKKIRREEEDGEEEAIVGSTERPHSFFMRKKHL